MLSLPAALGRAIGQLTDPAILAVLGKSMALTIAIVLAIGWAFSAAAQQLFSALGLGVSNDVGDILQVLATLIGGWLLFRIIAISVVQMFGDAIVRAVERKHYPDAETLARALPWPEELRASLCTTTRAVLVNGGVWLLALPLVVTGIGPAVLFLAVNAWLLGLELSELVQARHEPGGTIGRWARFSLGATIAGLMLVPIVNLIAPVLGAAAACHLFHRPRRASFVQKPGLAKSGQRDDAPRHGA